jgi:hypothetical protein
LWTDHLKKARFYRAFFCPVSTGFALEGIAQLLIAARDLKFYGFLVWSITGSCSRGVIMDVCRRVVIKAPVNIFVYIPEFFANNKSDN